MNCTIATGKVEDYAGDALIALQYENGPSPKGALRKVVKSAHDGGHFKGARGELFQIYPCEVVSCRRIILAGLGEKSKSSDENIRQAAGRVIRTVQNLKRVAFLPLDNPATTIVPLVDGAILGNYRFDRLKSVKKEIALKEIGFFTGDARIRQSVVSASQILAEGTCAARDLANLPANLLTPARLADEAVKLGKRYGVTVDILAENDLKKLNMGALLAVAQGSTNRPRMVVWHYRGGRAKASPVVLLGKGVTFDSGGLSIKSSEGMGAMKADMSAAGAVISLIQVLGQLRPKINVVGITPLVENMPSGTAFRPGDVVTASNGKTIEVISTDAEGRMILADALVYAKKFKPKYVVDIATLTGACSVALGLHIAAGVMGNNQRLVDMLINAGQQAGERLWQLPLWDDYRELLKSPAADMKNSGGRYGGAITAAIFLSNFAEGYPWAHLDIAGMDFEESDHPYRWKGGTGWGVRVLARFLLNRAGYRL